MTGTPPRRLLACVAACALTLVSAPITAAAEAPANSVQSARWLAGELTDGALPGFAGPDWGLTLDALFALSATGADPAALKGVSAALSRHVRAYNSFDDYEIPGVRIAGATAKLLVGAVAAGEDPADYGGFDLRAETLALVAATGADAGRVKDAGTDDGSNTFGQAYAVLGLARSGGVPAPVVDFLLRQQCAAGGFRLSPDQAGAPAPTCDDAANPVLDPDSTSVAVQALYAAGAKAAADKGVSWLAATQRADGSFGGSGPTDSSNTNSTGLAAQALAAGGSTAAAKRATDYLAARRLTGATDTGAVAYNDAALAEAAANGIDEVQRDQWRRATAQAVLGLAGVPMGELGPVAPQPGPVGRVADYLVAGLTDGDHVQTSTPDGSYTDHGQTADVAYALLATGARPESLAKVRAFLTAKANVDAYAHGAPFDKPDANYAGATGKLALLVSLAGQDPRAVGGSDLIAELKSLQGPDGRFADDSTFGDYANVYGQAFGVLALTAAGETGAAAKAVTALIAARCADGTYPVDFPAAPCATGTADTTGLAVQALNASAGTGSALPAAQHDALVAAVGALVAQRDASGAWRGQDGLNTNSTGYAAAGLLSVGQTVELSRGWLAGLLGADGGLPTAPGGASNRLASAQALPALAGRSLLTVAPGVLAPAERVAPQPPTTTPTTPPPTTTTTTAAPTGTSTTDPTDPTAPTATAVEPDPRGAPPGLATTGGPAGLIALAALALLGTGTALVLIARRRAA